MRMWMVNPRIMCRQHLLGEHLEIHMFTTAIMQNVSVQGYINNNLLEIASLQTRHDELVAEMIRRGYNHNSPWKGDWVKIAKHFQWERIKDIKVDNLKSLYDLSSRCESCRTNELMLSAHYADTDSIMVIKEGESSDING